MQNQKFTIIVNPMKTRPKSSRYKFVFDRLEGFCSQFYTFVMPQPDQLLVISLSSEEQRCAFGGCNSVTLQILGATRKNTEENDGRTTKGESTDKTLTLETSSFTFVRGEHDPCQFFATKFSCSNSH